MFERFTNSAREVVVLTQEEARMLRDDRIGTEHLLLGLLRADTPHGGASGKDGNAAREALLAHGVDLAGMRARIEAARISGGDDLDADALAAIGIDLDQVRAATEASFGPGALDPRARSRPKGHIAFDATAKKSLELSLRHALRLKHKFIGTGHILLGVLHDDDTAAGLLLRQMSVDLEGLRADVTNRTQSEAARR